jgi:pyruvate kinase
MPLEEGRRRSDKELVEMAARIARDADADAVLAVTADGSIGRLLAGTALPAPLVIATANPDTHAALAAQGLEPVRLPLLAADRFGQIRHALAVASR